MTLSQQPLPQAEENSVAVQLSAEDYANRKRLMQLDPWYFSKYVCRHGEMAVERIHRPLLYVYTRQAHLLVACLDDPRFAGEITDQVKKDLVAHGIDWNDPAQLPRVRARLQRVQVRAPRGIGKSLMADDGDLWEATMDPDTTISLGTKADTYAQNRITAMGGVVLSDEYRFWFPERVPTDTKHDVTQDAITLAGRKTIKTEATIEGRGIKSPWTGRHYRKNRRDDIVGTESGDASVEDALGHLAQMGALQDRTQWEGDLYIGTSNGEGDDFTYLLQNPDVMSIVMPIERVYVEGKEVEVDADTVWLAGVPTMPEWKGFDESGLAEMKRTAKTNPYGLIALLQNMYMVAHKSGSVIFPPSLLTEAKFLWMWDERLKRELIWRPKLGKEKTCRDEECTDPAHPFDARDWFVLDPIRLPSSAKAWAFDQSVSESGEADQWSGSIVFEDHEGVAYLIENIAGLGYDQMLDEVPKLDAAAGKPPRNGFDSDATQSMTTKWMQRDAASNAASEWRDIIRRVEDIRSGGQSKEAQIINVLQAPMRSGGFYYNPDLREFANEARRYKPRRLDGRKKKRPVDNRLDSARMARQLTRRPSSPDEITSAENSYRSSQLVAARYRDKATGIDGRSWMGQITDWRPI